MKIFSAAQIKACDAYTIHAEGISSAELMERAATACVQWVSEKYSKEVLFVVLCGMGNNGGDGLAITRLLLQRGYGAKAFVLKYTNEFSQDCFLNLEKLQQAKGDYVNLLQPGTFLTDIQPHIVIIDAIFGTGLNRTLKGWLAEFIEHINNLPNEKVAVDMPTGLMADNIPEDDEVILSADFTLSFQFYKRSFLHRETGIHAGKIFLIDINLNQTFIEGSHTQYQTIEPNKIKKKYKPREPFSHKGTYGAALIIAGSYGMIGAAMLATKSAARAGAGKVFSLVPACGYDILQTSVPEALCTVNGEQYLTQIKIPEGVNSIGIGPGIGTNPLTIKAFSGFLENCKQVLVIDADAINILAKQPELLYKLPHGSILTPHPKEYERLFGNTANSMMQTEHARFQAMRYNIYIILKGRHTVVVTPEGNCFYNLTGNAGLATGGSGDVLTGMLTALLAQNYTSFEASVLGVYLHGLAADIALGEQSMETMLAGDIIAHFGSAFKTLL